MFSCSNSGDSEYKKIEKYFRKTHNFKLNSKINTIVVIDEGNNCPSCDKAIAKKSLECLQNSNTIFLITARGAIVDISPFLKMEKNCFFDWQLNSFDYPELKGSRLIRLKDYNIDTTIVINSKEIRQQLDFICE